MTESRTDTETLVVESTWRALPDPYEPPNMLELQRQAEDAGCTLVASVQPEEGGYRHTLSMVPRTEPEP